MRRTIAAVSLACLLLVLAGCDASTPPGSGPTPAATSASPDPLARLNPAVRAFLSDDREHPFGEPGEGAPPENGFFAALVGVWSCKLRFDQGNGVIRFGYPATWAFKYSAGGYAIEHLYHQTKANLVPPLAPIGRDFHSVSLVLYDPALKAWRFVSANNLAGSPVGSNTQVMTGHVANDALTFLPDVQNPNLYAKETFHGIGAEDFTWTQSESGDQGRTWNESATVVCKRRL